MRLDDLDPSGNINDQGRGGGGFRGFGGGGGGGIASLLIGLLPMLFGRKLGCGAIAIIAVVGFFIFNSGALNFGGSGMSSGDSAQQGSSGNVACDTEAELFACRVFTSTEQTWTAIFREAGAQYRPAKLEFYQRGGRSGCGAAQSAMGPFYCPSDQGIYLDTSFFAQMEKQMKAGGDFAYAYVIAHEMGHHIQTLTGTAAKVRQRQARAGKAEGNQLQVRMELQADCYAGVWANRNKNRLEAGDVEEGMRAANAIGDDNLMRQSGQRPVESMFTHGSSEQRMAALKRGLQSGDPQQCDFFKGVF
ncbi:MAG: neutral zinc metallopeptidase [Sphingorhabdus sp.]